MTRRIGVYGVGHLGKIHLKCLGQLTDRYELVGFYDPDDAAARAAEENFGIKRFPSPDSLLNEIEVMDVVAPTQHHHALISMGLRAGKHVFTEKPVTDSVEQAAELSELANAANLKVQVGHVERYNPAFKAIRGLDPKPMFIEGHRLAQFNPRGTEVSVVLDLMIHDLDILVTLIDAPVAEIRASGVAVMSEQPDICNARIEFENGAVANLTASRVSLKNMRKLRMFQQDAYLSVDFLEKQAEIVQLSDTKPDAAPNALEIELNGRSKWITMEQPAVESSNAILEELASFHDAIHHDRTPDVTLDDALASMRIAHQILHAIESSAEKAKIS